MRICIDARIPNQGGIRTCVQELIQSIIKIDKENQYFIFYDSKQGVQGYKNVIEHVVPTNNKIVWILWGQTYLPYFLRKNKIDVFHSLKHVGAFFTKSISLITIYDAGPFLFPEAWKFAERIYWQQMFKLAGRFSDGIITISQKSKETLTEALNVSPDKIHFNLIGINHTQFHVIEASKNQRVKEKYNLPEKFLFWVGLMMETKNISTLIKAFAKAKEDGLEHKLVLGGRDGREKNNVKVLIQELGIESEVIFLGFIDDKDLASVYNLADIFVFPSKHEGFGLPIVEAMACGTPVIASNSFSHPEVIGDAGILFETMNENDLKDKIIMLVSNTKLYNILVEKGLKRASMYSSDKCAQETINLYKDYVNNKNRKK